MNRFGMFGSWALSACLFTAGPALAKELRDSGSSADAGRTVKRSAEFNLHLERALQLYDAGSFSEAIEEFQLAYERQQLPRILFNMARAHIQLGHAEEALGLQQKFLQLEGSPAPEIRKQAQDDIDKARGMLEAAERIRAVSMSRNKLADEPPPAGVSLIAVEQSKSRSAATTTDAPAIYKRWWFWTVVGGAVALAGAVTGGVLGYQATHPPLPIEQVPSGVSIFAPSF